MRTPCTASPGLGHLPRGRGGRGRPGRCPPLARACVAACAEIDQCGACTREFFMKSFLDDEAAVLAPSSGEESSPPRRRAGVASMAWRTRAGRREKLRRDAAIATLVAASSSPHAARRQAGTWGLGSAPTRSRPCRTPRGRSWRPWPCSRATAGAARPRWLSRALPRPWGNQTRPPRRDATPRVERLISTGGGGAPRLRELSGPAARAGGHGRPAPVPRRRGGAAGARDARRGAPARRGGGGGGLQAAQTPRSRRRGRRRAGPHRPWVSLATGPATVSGRTATWARGRKGAGRDEAPVSRDAGGLYVLRMLLAAFGFARRRRHRPRVAADAFTFPPSPPLRRVGPARESPLARCLHPIRPV